MNGPRWNFSSSQPQPQRDPCNDNGDVWQGIMCSLEPNLCKTQECQILSLKLISYGLDGFLPSLRLDPMGIIILI